MRAVRPGLFVVALAAACSPATSPAPLVVEAALPAPAPAVTAAPEGGPPCPCAELGRAHRAVLAGTPLADLQRPRGAEPPLMPASFGACLPTPHGHWAVVVTALGADPPADVACWAIVHVDEAGREARVYPGALSGEASHCEPTFDGANLVYGNFSSVAFSEPVLADLDGDGEPEIFVKRTGLHENQDVVGSNAVWSFRGGAVVRFPVPRGMGVIEVRDVDGDGRADVVTVPYHTAGAHLCGLQSTMTFPVTGPALLAHARADGSFSLDDDVARAFARQQCPRRPRRLGGLKGVVGLDIGCALLWGATEPEIVRGLATCSPRPDEKPDPFCRELCEQDKGFVKAFAGTPPPLRLAVP